MFPLTDAQKQVLAQIALHELMPWLRDFMLTRSNEQQDAFLQRLTPTYRDRPTIAQVQERIDNAAHLRRNTTFTLPTGEVLSVILLHYGDKLYLEPNSSIVIREGGKCEDDGSLSTYGLGKLVNGRLASMNKSDYLIITKQWKLCINTSFIECPLNELVH